MLVSTFSPSGFAAETKPPLRVLAATFTMQQFTRNVTSGVEGVQVEPLLSAGLGCPHDYVLTPQDMRKLERADVLVVNGLGLEEFIGAPLFKSGRLKVIDSSRGVEGPLNYAGAQTPNPHLFASPLRAARIVVHIAAELSRIYPQGEAAFTANAKAYAAKLEALAADLKAAAGRLKNRRIVTQHGVFDYFARDAGLEIVAVIQAHAGTEPSAAEMLRLVAGIKATRTGAIFAEPQYPSKIPDTLARETGIPAATLDPVASGPENAGLDYYEKTMRANIKTLEKTLGTP